jgi:hypothetical protein
LRALTGVAASSSKTALTMHFAINDNAGLLFIFLNVADLQTKECSQETLIVIDFLIRKGIIGTFLGYLVTKMLPTECKKDDYVCSRKELFVTWSFTLFMVCLHLLFNYLAIRCVTLNTLSRQRTHIIIKEFLDSNRILSPLEVSQKESILSPLFSNDRIILGESLSNYSTAIIETVMNSRKDVVIIQQKCGKILIFIRTNLPKTVIIEHYILAMFMRVGNMTESKARIMAKSGICKKIYDLGWKESLQCLPILPYQFERSNSNSKTD